MTWLITVRADAAGLRDGGGGDRGHENPLEDGGVSARIRLGFRRTLGADRALDAAAALVSVFVSFVDVRAGSASPADGPAEHGADADDRS